MNTENLVALLLRAHFTTRRPKKETIRSLRMEEIIRLATQLMEEPNGGSRLSAAVRRSRIHGLPAQGEGRKGGLT